MKGLFSRRSRKRRADPQELLQTIFASIQARTWDESRRVVEAHPELLTDEADNLMGRLAEAQEDSKARRMVEEHRALLRRCREVGIERAFAEETGGSVPEEMRPLLDALASLPMDQRDTLMELFARADSPEALEAVLDGHPGLRAALEQALAQAPSVAEEQVQDHPLYRLGRRVMNGDLTLEQALEEALVPSTLALLDDNAVNGLDDHIVALSRDPARTTEARVLAYVLAELNHTAAQTLPASPAIRAYIANTLGNCINDYPFKTPIHLKQRVEAYQEALVVWQEQGDQKRTAMLQNNLGTAYSRLAQVREREANLQRAIDAYQQTLAMIDYFFAAASVGAQLGLQGEWAGLYARAVAAYRQAGEIAQALAIGEGSKSRLLTTLLGWGQLPAPPTVPPDLAQREQGLAARLAALDAADLAQHGRTTPSDEGAGRVAHLQQRQSLLEELNALWEQMIHNSGDDPEVTDYVELRRGDRPDWGDLAHLATDLGGDTALLSLFTTGEQTLLFVLRAGMDAPKVVEAPLDGTDWEVVLRRFLREVHFHDGSGRRGETWLRPLPPLLEAAVPHLAGARRVVFAPQGRGHLLPWGLLARRAGWEAPVVTVPALGLLEHVLRRPAKDGAGASVATVPALGLLERVLRRPARDRAGTLVVGNPTRNLPYASEEARRVARILGTRPLVGRKATRQAVLSRLGEVGLAHFATHAYFAAGSPLDSGIVPADGVLTAREILERGLRAPEFLALSACQTGMAESLGGDEMAGLSQALLYAGARSLLVSLWTVNDPATAHLMTGFYRRWQKEGQDKATALRDAMDTTRQAQPQWAHTYYWGAFTLVGDWR